MKSDKDIIAEAHARIEENLTVTSWWRANEIRDNYGLYEGSQWLQNDITRQIANNMPIRTINRVQPIVDAITGFQIQNRTGVRLVPRTTEEDQTGYADLGNDGIKWIQDVSNYDMSKSLATSDMLIAGMGFVDYKIGYGDKKTYNSSQTDSGNPCSERVFPYFMLWDVTTRNKNLEGANWICRAKIISQQAAKEYIGNMNPDNADPIEFGAGVDARFLEYFDTIMTTESLSVIFNYQWREKKLFYRIENPLKGFEGDPRDIEVQRIVDIARVIQDKYDINPYIDRYFTVSAGDFKDLREAFELIGFFNLEKTGIKKWVYYRADIIGDKVISKSENFSQCSFSIKAMTGKYDENRQCYYGIVRSLKEPQRLLNQAVSDYEGFLRTIPKGGVFIELDAVIGGNMEGFRDTYLKASEITPLASGAISGGKIMPKNTPPVPSGLLEMIEYASRSMMEVIGLTSDFMGRADSKLMTAQLNSQLVRQGLMVLAPYFDSITLFTKTDGELFLDMLRVLLENEEGRLIGHITPEGNIVNVPLMESNLCPEYDVVVEESPVTPDERQQTFEKLLELAQLLASKPEPVDISPIVMEYAPLKQNEINAVKAMMQPPPPPPPDPIQEALLQSTIAKSQAETARETAAAKKYEMETLLKQQELQQSRASAELENLKDLRSAEYDRARTLKTLQDINLNR